MISLRHLYAERAQLGYELDHGLFSRHADHMARYLDVQQRLALAEKRWQVAGSPPALPDYQYTWCSACGETLSKEEIIRRAQTCARCTETEIMTRVYRANSV